MCVIEPESYNQNSVLNVLCRHTHSNCLLFLHHPTFHYRRRLAPRHPHRVSPRLLLLRHTGAFHTPSFRLLQPLTIGTHLCVLGCCVWSCASGGGSTRASDVVHVLLIITVTTPIIGSSSSSACKCDSIRGGVYALGARNSVAVFSRPAAPYFSLFIIINIIITTAITRPRLYRLH